MRAPRRREPLDLARASATWAVTGAAAIALAGVASALGSTELAPLGPASLGLGATMLLVAAPALAVVAWGVRRLGRAWPAPIVVLAFLGAWQVTSAPAAERALAYAELSLGFAAGVVAAAFLARRAHPGWNAAGLAVAVIALVLDRRMPPTLYVELHDLLGLLVLFGVAAALTPLRRRVARLPAARLGPLCLVGPLVLTVALVAGWPPPPGDRWARAARALVDVDADGFSPLLGGGDCDDLDGKRNPLERDPPGGGDANCNGIDLPGDPPPAARGLAPLHGDPAYPPGAIDLVVVITIDALRAEALDPAVMPHVARLAASGVSFARAYAGGSRTVVSMPILVRGGERLPPVPALLARRGVTSTLVLGSAGTEVRVAEEGFARVVRPPHGTWPAETVTARALEALYQRPALLWVHYYDPHDPYEQHDGFAPAAPPGQAGYRSELAYTDAHIGRLVAALAERMDTTVVIVTGDHGEGFGEDGVYFHGVGAGDAILHVPALIAAPGLAPATHAHLVSHRDLAPTILCAFAACDDAERFGASWLRLRASSEPLHEFVVSRSFRFASGTTVHLPIAAITTPAAQLVVGFQDGSSELRGGGDRRALRRQLETFRDAAGF